MNIKENKKIGMRTVKTVLGIFIATYIGVLFNRPNLTTIMASVFITLAGSINETLTISKNRILAVLIGAILGAVMFLFITTPLSVALFTALGTLMLILLTNKLKWYNTLFLALVVVTAVTTTPFDNNIDMLSYLFNLLIDTILGIIIGVLININISKPNTENMLLTTLKQNQENINKSFKLYLLNDRSTENLSNILSLVNKTEDLYVKYKEDYKLNDKHNKYYLYDIKDIFTNQIASLGLIINLITANIDYIVPIDTINTINNFYGEEIVKDSRIATIDSIGTIGVKEKIEDVINYITINEQLLNNLKIKNNK